tara:strand:+ start:633 stop:962 length:330 start_codon:yes stop_codon:yes gene_type:complete
MALAWKIINVHLHSDDKNEDIVRIVEWEIIGSDKSSYVKKGATCLDAPKDSFEKFNDLSQAKLIEWVKAVENKGGVDKVALFEEEVKKNIAQEPSKVKANRSVENPFID